MFACQDLRTSENGVRWGCLSRESSLGDKAKQGLLGWKSFGDVVGSCVMLWWGCCGIMCCAMVGMLWDHVLCHGGDVVGSCVVPWWE